MSKHFPEQENKETLTDEQQRLIEQKARYSLIKNQYTALKLSALANPFASLIVLLPFYKSLTFISLPALWWYAFLGINIVCFLASNYFLSAKFNYQHTRQLRQWYYILLTLLTCGWGFINVLAAIAPVITQLYLFGLLLAITAGFTFGTSTDATANKITTNIMLIPYALYHTFLLIRFLIIKNVFTNFSLDNLSTYYHDHIFMDVFLNHFIIGVGLIVVAGYIRKYSNNSAALHYNATVKTEEIQYLLVELDKHKRLLEEHNKELDKKVHERTQELRMSLEHNRYLATHDPLTKLYNYSRLLEIIQEAINKANNNNTSFGLVCIAIKDLNVFIDSYGDTMANRLIAEFAARLKFKVDEINNVYKVNYQPAISRRDSFYVLFEPDEVANNHIDEILPILKQPFYINNRESLVDAYFGVCYYPLHGKNADELMTNSELVISIAKQDHFTHNSIRVYNEETGAVIRLREALESDLKDALARNEFSYVFQPIINAQTNEVASVEALIRWNNPRLGYVSPLDFIPIAEETGYIIPIGQWISKEACKSGKQLHELGFKIKVSVNVSAIELKAANYIDSLKAILNETQFDPDFLDLELTESASFKTICNIESKLKEIQTLGISISIDDFGSERSNTDMVKLLIKLHNRAKLKLDRQYVTDCLHNIFSQSMIKASADIAHSSNLILLAEGVETKEQLDYLVRQGYHLIQGYYFSKPLTYHELIQFLELHKNGIQYDKLVPVLKRNG